MRLMVPSTSYTVDFAQMRLLRNDEYGPEDLTLLFGLE